MKVGSIQERFNIDYVNHQNTLKKVFFVISNAKAVFCNQSG